MAQLIASTAFRSTRSDGTPNALGLVYFYAAGTLTPQATYTTQAGNVPNGNPVTMGADGTKQVWLDTTLSYRVIERTVSGELIRDTDNIGGDSFLISLAGTEATEGAGIIGFNPTKAYAAATVGRSLAESPLNPKDAPWLAAFNGVTDDTAAINACAAAARASGAGRSIVLPRNGTALVTGSLDFSGIHVQGLGPTSTQINIQASSAQFDVIVTTGNTTLDGVYVHGGWDGSTAGLSGDILKIDAVSPAYPYDVHIKNCTFQFAKGNGCYWGRAGYSSWVNNKINACGLHAMEVFAPSGSDSATTVYFDGANTLSDCPNGYGLKITNCISMCFKGLIIEYTKGIQFNGNDNRALTFEECYQENTSGGKFFVDNASAGIGLCLKSLYGAGATMDPLVSWTDVVNLGGHAAIIIPALPDAGSVLSADGGSMTTAVTGGNDLTVTSLSIPPGRWRIDAHLQTLDSSGSALVGAACLITPTVSDSGLSNNVAGTFNPGAAQGRYTPIGGQSDIRLNCGMYFRNSGTANVTVYLRAWVNISAGTIAYRGQMYAARVA